MDAQQNSAAKSASKPEGVLRLYQTLNRGQESAKDMLHNIRKDRLVHHKASTWLTMNIPADKAVGQAQD